MEEYRDKFNKLPTIIRNFFISNAPLIEIKKSFAIFNIDSEKSKDIAKELGLIYVKDIKLKDLPQIITENLHLEKNITYGIAFEINSRIFARFPEYFTDALELLEQWEKLKTPPIISEDEAWKKVLELEPWILETEKEERETKKEMHDENIRIQSAMEKITVRNAIQKFPALGEQLITSAKIKLKNFPEPVRPSINNWLSDYTFSLGYESHSAMDRGTYLFRNENARLLNSMDREKLSYLLKAYDENSPVDINTNTSQIIFPRHETRNNEQGTMSNSQRTIINEQRTTSNEQRTTISNPQFQTPQRNISEIYNATKKPDKPSDIFQEERTATQKRNTANLSFSSPQKFPYEKQAIQPQQPTHGPEPLHISSQNLRHDPVPPGNVVNLKDQNH